MINEPPIGDNLEAVKRWAVEQLRKLDTRSVGYVQFDEHARNDVGANQLRPGLVAYFGKDGHGPGSAEGLYVLTSAGWVAL